MFAKVAGALIQRSALNNFITHTLTQKLHVSNISSLKSATIANLLNDRKPIRLLSSDPSKVEASDVFPTRPVRQEPSPVKLAFIPEEWFTFFHKKTGVSGFYVFFFTFPTYLISKEIYVMEHEYYSCLSVFVTSYLAVTQLGPGLARSLDREIDKIENNWNVERKQNTQSYNDMIKNEEQLQWSMEGQLLLNAAKAENVHLQLEYDYRGRLLLVYKRVKQLLDFQIAAMGVDNKYLHRNKAEWVKDEVLKIVSTPDYYDQEFDRCIDNLHALAVQYQK